MVNLIGVIAFVAGCVAILASIISGIYRLSAKIKKIDPFAVISKIAFGIVLMIMWALFIQGVIVIGGLI